MTDEPEVITLDESQLSPDMKKIVDEFKEQKAQKIPKEEIESWFEEMMKITPETLPQFIEKISNVEHDYYSMISGATVVALAALKVFNLKHNFKDKNQGIRIANSIYATITGIGDDPFRVFEFYSLLDPACDGQYSSIPKQIVAVLRNKATDLLSQHPDAPVALRKRWRQIANGKLPENWVVRESRQ